MAILSGLFLVVAMAIAVALLRPLLVFVAKLLAGVFIAIVSGIGLGLAAETQWPGAGVLVGFFAVALCFVPSVWLVWSLCNATPSTRRHVPERSPLSVTSPTPATQKLEPAGDEPVAAAWARAFELMPQEKGKLSEARRSCAALLKYHSADSPSDHEVTEAVTLIRRHVPALLKETEAACRGADANERVLLLSQLVAQLEALAARSAAIIERTKQQARDDLALRHLHLRNRLSELGGAPVGEPLQPISAGPEPEVAKPASDAGAATWWSWFARPLTMWR